MFLNRAHAELSLKKNYWILCSDNIGWPSNLDGNDWSRSDCTNFVRMHFHDDDVILTYHSIMYTNQIDYNLYFRNIDFYLYARARCFHH